MHGDRSGTAEREHGLRLQHLLDAMESLPQDRHAQFLEAHCPDPALRAEVLALLAAEAAADAYIEDLAGDLFCGSLPPTETSGTQIGPYRLLHVIGRGGMGSVYLAVRDDGTFEHQVALKRLDAALPGTQAHDRFVAERQILAGLKHPSIAHILDGGVTPGGLPWFAMEYVDGVPITDYCNGLDLDIDRRLALFLQVCAAVEHAHSRLVVHSDLKPGNVLVTDAGEVKLLDFGIARLQGDAEARTDPSGPASASAWLMTPAYASPEQVRGEPTTTASDVYQLGVLLYELLTGRRPDPAVQPGVAPGPTESPFLRPCLSTALPASSSGVSRLPFHDGTARARWRRRLRGDLDSIVTTAIQADPGRRYTTADRLAQDVRRHLQGLPVTARPLTLRYRAGKFVRRHVLGVAAAALVVLLGSGLVVFHTARLQNERDRAQIASAKAERMNRFLIGLFRSADPTEGSRADLTARELLDRGVAQVDRDLGSDPQVQANMLQVLGRTYLELGVYSSADALLDRALTLHSGRMGASQADVGATLGDIGLLRYEEGKYAQARDHLLEAERRLRAALPERAGELADVLRALGRVRGNIGEHRAAREALEEALALQRPISGEESVEVATILMSLGLLQVAMGDPVAAERSQEKALAIYERVLGTEHLAVAIGLNDLANSRLYQGRLDGLEAMYRRSYEIVRTVYGPDHPRVGRPLNNLGHVLTTMGRPAEAIAVLRMSLEIQESAGREHPEVAYPLTTLADAHLANGDFAEARRYYERSTSIRQAAVGARDFDPLLAHGLVMLGHIDRQQGDAIAAAERLNQAAAVWSRVPAPMDPRLEPGALELGRWLVEQKRCAEALPLLRRASEVHGLQTQPDPTHVAETTALLGRCG